MCCRLRFEAHGGRPGRSLRLRLGEHHKLVGPHAVELHSLGSCIGLHGLLEGVHIGNVQDHPVRFDFSGSTKVRTVIPRGPKNSPLRGELSQWSTLSTSWKAINVVTSCLNFLSHSHMLGYDDLADGPRLERLLHRSMAFVGNGAA